MAHPSELPVRGGGELNAAAGLADNPSGRFFPEDAPWVTRSAIENSTTLLHCALPTGRPAFPGFVARSRANPASELRDASVWAQLWRNTRARLAAAEEVPVFNRWKVNGAVCA